MIVTYLNNRIQLDITKEELEMLENALKIAYKPAYQVHYPKENRLRETITKINNKTKNLTQ